jgi:lia operon protein LiaG
MFRHTRVIQRSLLTSTATLIALIAHPLDAQTEQRSIRGDHVAVYNLVGQLSVVAGSGDAVQVDVTRRGTDGAQLRIETGPLGGRETLRVVYPGRSIIYPELRRGRISGIGVRDDGTFSDGDWRELSSRNRVEIRASGSGLDAHANLVVRVPRGQRISVYLAVGRAEVTNVEGEIYVDVGSADLDVSRTRGVLTLDTGSGRISVRNATGDLSIDAGSGGMTLEAIRGSVLNIDSGSGGVDGTDIEVAQLSADIGSGGLRFTRTRAPRVKVETGSGGATLEMLGEIETLDIETGSGGVTVRAPATLSADVDIETGSGGFRTDFEITTRRLSRDHIQGRIGAGKGRVRIEAGSGTVRLLKSAT